MVFLLSLCTIQIALADDWNLKDKDGTHYKLSEQKGKWVLVNFWAPWCPRLPARNTGTQCAAETA